METTPPPSLTEVLANLPLTTILIVVAALTVLRLVFIRVQSPAARSAAELFESALIAIVLVFMVIRPFAVQAYFIPSPSMEPTLLGKDNVGDKILVNKFGYRLHSPQRNDVVVFLAPPAAMEGNPDFIKRLIGTPGDHIQSVHGSVVVDGQEFNHEEVRNKLAAAGVFGSDAQAQNSVDQADHHVRFVDNGVLADGVLVPKDRLPLIMMGMSAAPVVVHPGYNIRNGQRLAEPFIAEDPDYDLSIYDGKPLKHDFGQEGTPQEYKLDGQFISPSEYRRDLNMAGEPIPPGKYLMMGDNRNDSRDSTEWGLLDKRRVVGHAVFIFWPLNRIHPIR